MSHDINGVLRSLMTAANIVRQCKSELLEHGFSQEETDDILKFYVYDKVNREEE
jgi:hypothetical protein